ncbi:hypothetical protein ILFOPFJJ_06652 [Ensifer psoraleae]|nr:hypothetical protein [Sinorhizobium psoraleae]
MKYWKLPEIVPLGLGHVGARSDEFLPWAWGINGCASVLSAILAALLAMHVGFTGVVTIAAILYLAAPALLAGSQGFVPDRKRSRAKPSA